MTARDFHHQKFENIYNEGLEYVKQRMEMHHMDLNLYTPSFVKMQYKLYINRYIDINAQIFLYKLSININFDINAYPFLQNVQFITHIN